MTCKAVVTEVQSNLFTYLFSSGCRGCAFTSCRPGSLTKCKPLTFHEDKRDSFVACGEWNEMHVVVMGVALLCWRGCRLPYRSAVSYSAVYRVYRSSDVGCCSGRIQKFNFTLLSVKICRKFNLFQLATLKLQKLLPNS